MALLALGLATASCGRRAAVETRPPRMKSLAEIHLEWGHGFMLRGLLHVYYELPADGAARAAHEQIIVRYRRAAMHCTDEIDVPRRYPQSCLRFGGALECSGISLVDAPIDGCTDG